MAGGCQYAPGFRQKGAPIRKVLDDLERYHQFEGAIGIRKRHTGSLFETQVGKRIVFRGEGDGFGSYVNTHDGIRRFG